MRKTTRLFVIIASTTTLLASTALPSFAGSTGRKNTAIVLTAATVHQFLNKKDRNAIVLGLASAQAWKSYEDARKRESRNHYYYSGYRSSQRGHAYGHYKNRRR